MLEKGDLLVPVETPYGPAEAREAWADELGNLLVVVRVLDAQSVRVNCPSTGETVDRMAADILESYERSDAGEPESWHRFIVRVATECARIERRAGEDDGTYWQRVAAVATRVRVEESDVARVEFEKLSARVVMSPATEERAFAELWDSDYVRKVAGSEENARKLVRDILSAAAAQIGPELADLDTKQLGPFVSTSETSRRAAVAAYPKQGTQRERIVEYMHHVHVENIARGGLLRDVAKVEAGTGRTRDELAHGLGMSPNTVRPRVVELIEGGWMRETEHVRAAPGGRDCAVLVLTAKALEHLAEKAA